MLLQTHLVCLSACYVVDGQHIDPFFFLCFPLKIHSCVCVCLSEAFYKVA